MAKFFQILLLAACFLTLPLHVSAIERIIHAAWEYQKIGNETGFSLYYENNPVCIINDPNATAVDCLVDAPDGESWFTITARFQDGSESPHSEPYSYTFSSDLKAIFTADILTGESPLTVVFDATSSNGNIFTYEWMFGDGEIGTGNIANHTFISAGAYTVTLKITGDNGAFDRETIAVNVTSPTMPNTPPTAVISSSASVGDAPLDIQFDGTRSSDSDGTIISHQWDLGDGGTSSSARLDYSYFTPGTFHAALTVTDDGGLSDNISTPVLVTQPPEEINIPPNAVITALAHNIKKPLTIFFHARKSNDPDGHIRNYTWNFGDGAGAYGISVKHTYSLDAVYIVTLTATDDKGAHSLPAKYRVTIKDGAILENPNTFTLISIIDYILLKPQPVSVNQPVGQEE